MGGGQSSELSYFFNKLIAHVPFVGDRNLHTPGITRLACASTDLSVALHYNGRYLSTSHFPQHLQLSMQEGICEHVESLTVVPELFNGEYNAPYSTFSRWDCIQGALGRSQQEQDSEQVDGKAYYAVNEAAMADHQHALTSATSIILLQDCLRRFVNLSSVGLQYCPITGTGDICLGWRRFRAQLGFYPDFERERFPHKQIDREHDLAFSLLAEALIASGRKVKRLSTCGPHCYGVGLGRMQLTPEAWASFLSCLKGLSHLHFCHESSAISSHPERLCELLAAVAPSLETLRYQIGPYTSSIYLEPFRVRELFQGIPFQRLQTVRLRLIELPMDTLEQFLRAEQTKHHWWRLLEFIRDELNLQFFVLRKTNWPFLPRVDESATSEVGAKDVGKNGSF
ncbi:uncharacterized protein BO96DRAFT_433235 [Aspergillus niger CBS 101883]|uniref:uncharacterized protein n=1 Tax=Aspergillus lacticoffeatus (strain CBS 101883) TaxID=1450533 RepID=UPI000D7ED0F3|nr:uncharacterized protein BO96DRAFT_433235 [Aspergillus niger CBS 101883]PYH57788.1 hypothetical protein BO96DRAFT_433235 [Aspergillus niger CBS 101883]